MRMEAGLAEGGSAQRGSAQDGPAERHAPGRTELFLGFLGLGMTAFGGALPLARHMIVQKRRWMSEAEFTELLGLCQFLPGGNVVNLSVAVGYRFGGLSGALVAISGLLAVPTLVVIALGVIYDRYHDDPYVRHFFAGLAAAAAGLLLSMGIRIARPLLRRPWPALVALVCVLAIAVFRLPLLPTMIVLTPLAILASRRSAA